MKNKLKKLLTVMLGAILCFSSITLLASCGDETETTKSPIVYSNGGSVVVYDNEVYYINGIPDYTDASGQTNLTGGVVKGGLYKTTVTEYRNSLREVEAEENDDKADGLNDVLDFSYEKLDYKALGAYTIGSETEPARIEENGATHQNIISTNGERSEYRIVSEQVVSKKIGTSGYADGGFWIFDGVVYFATPDNDRNTAGEVQYERTEFYSYNLETQSMSLIYTTRESNASVPYAFFKRGNSVYLTTYESYFANADDETNNILTGYIVSTSVTNGRVGETKEIVSGVTSVYFPRIETYDPENPTNTVSDYIYYTRAAKTTDAPSTGSRLEMVSPDGNLPAVVENGKEVQPVRAGTKTILTNQSSSSAITIEGVSGDYLYFRNPAQSGITRLECTNLATQLKEYDPDVVVPAMPTNANVVIADVSAYTTILPIAADRPDPSASVYPCVLASTATGVYRISPLPSNSSVLVYNGEATLYGYRNGRGYGSVSSEEFNAFISFSAYQSSDNRTVNLLDGNLPNTTFDLDFFDVSYGTKYNGKETSTTESYAFYFANYTETATNYAYINKVSGLYDLNIDDRSNGVRLGVLAYGDRPTITCYDDECINWTHDHSSWDDLTPDEEEEESTMI